MKNISKIIFFVFLIFIAIFIILFLWDKLCFNNKNFKVALVISRIGDNGFADLQVKALEFVGKNYKLKTKIYLTYSFEKIEEYMEKAIKVGYNIIIGSNGLFCEKPIENLSKIYKNIYFISVDNELREYNNKSCSLTFKQNEASFLAGVLATKLSKSNVIGFIGGMNIDVINDFLIGFIEGVKYVDKNKEVKYFYNDIDGNKKTDHPFTEPELAAYLAKRLYDEYKVDIIYCVAGGSNFGVYDFIKDKPIYAIGVDTDQDEYLKGKILFSVLKNIDVGLIYIIDNIINGNFKNINYRLGLKENGVGLSQMKFTKNIVGEVNIKLIEELRIKIIKGEIIVSTKF
jgi:basic membrane protein A